MWPLEKFTMQQSDQKEGLSFNLMWFSKICNTFNIWIIYLNENWCFIFLYNFSSLVTVIHNLGLSSCQLRKIQSLPDRFLALYLAEPIKLQRWEITRQVQREGEGNIDTEREYRYREGKNLQKRKKNIFSKMEKWE